MDRLQPNGASRSAGSLTGTRRGSMTPEFRLRSPPCQWATRPRAPARRCPDHPRVIDPRASKDVEQSALMTTVNSFSGLMMAGGAALGGIVHDPVALIIMFTAINQTVRKER